MNRPLLGAAAGLLLAAALVGCVALAGEGGSLHLDLSPGGARPASGGSGLVVTVAPSPGSQSAQNSAGEGGTTTPPSTSSGGLGFENGGSAGLLLPILIGGALGAVFYGVYARRVDAE